MMISRSFVLFILMLSVSVQSQELTIRKSNYDALLVAVENSCRVYAQILLGKDPKIDADLTSFFSTNFMLYISSLSYDSRRSISNSEKICFHAENLKGIQSKFQKHVSLYSEDDASIISSMLESANAVFVSSGVDCEMVKSKKDTFLHQLEKKKGG